MVRARRPGDVCDIVVVGDPADIARDVPRRYCHGKTLAWTGLAVAQRVIAPMIVMRVETKTHPDRHSRTILISEVRSLVPPSTREVLSVRQQTRCCESNMRVDRLYSFVRALDEEFRVEESLDS